MVKAIWAVACPAGLLGALLLVCAGCATAPQKTGDAKPPGQSVEAGEGTPQKQDNNAVTAGGASAKTDPASAPPAASGTAFVASGPNYRLGPEDALKVSVWGNKELTLDVVVRPDGKISFPLIQDVQAEGLTATELADIIHQKLLSFVKEPQVSVIVLQVNAPKVYVVGNVAKPGPYFLRSDMSVLQALSLAGGFTPFASPRSIKIVRNSGAGKQEVRKINYYNLIDEDGEGNYLLKPGDTIIVP